MSMIICNNFLPRSALNSYVNKCSTGGLLKQVTFKRFRRKLPDSIRLPSPSAEQERVIEEIKQGGNVKVIAVAGSGKKLPSSN